MTAALHNHKAAFGTERFLILGHRGSPRAAPENTIPSFLKAREQGAGGIELDVHLTREGAIAVFHNYTLSKTTGAKGLLARRTMKELKELDAGSFFSHEYAGASIPTLPEVIEALDRDALIMIEMKSYLGRANRRIAGAVAAVVAKYNLHERAVVSSFNLSLLKEVREADRHIALGFLHHLPCQVFCCEGGALPGGPEVLHPFHRFIGRNYMKRARLRGRRVIPWTVNQTADIERLLSLEVDGLISDYPGTVKKVLQAAGAERGKSDAR